jgi:tetratricopeptide (TPR) repeat protein
VGLQAVMKAQLNWRLLGWVVGAVVCLGLCVHLLHGVQVRRTAGAFLQQAREAEEQDRSGDAVRLLAHYVSTMPNDPEGWARYGLAVHKLGTFTGRWRALGAFEEVLKRQPTHHEVRRQLVHLALELERYQDVQNHAQILLQFFPDDGDLERALGRCQEANREYAAAAEWYEQSIEHEPRQVEGYVRFAALLRRHLDQPGRADSIMDTLVKENGDSAPALLARGLYRRENGSLDDAVRDVERARQLEPKSADVLLAAADLARRRGKADEARACLWQGIEAHPDHEALYQALAALETQAGRQPEAIDCLRRGVRALPKNKALLMALADALLSENEPAETVGLLDRLAKVGTNSAALQLRHGRLEMQQGRWAEAARRLELVQAREGGTPQFFSEVNLYLGRCYEQLGDLDQQLAVYRRGLTLDPLSARLRLGLAATLVAMDRTNEGLGEFWQAMKGDDAPPAGWVLLARVLLQQNLRRVPGQRNWRDFDRALDQAERALPGAVDGVLLRAEALVMQGQAKRAEELLAVAKAKQPGAVELYAAQALLADRRGDGRGALQILDEAQKRSGDVVALRVARAHYWTRRGTVEARDRLAELEQGADRYSADDHAQLLRGLAEAYARAGDGHGATRLRTRLAELRPTDLNVRLLLFDAALHDEDPAGMERWLAEIRRIEGNDGAYWRYVRALQLVLRIKKGDASDSAEARKCLAEARARRPTWARLPLLEANLDELEGQPQRALENYLRAIELGDQQPRVLQRAMQLLSEYGRQTKAS